MKDRIYQGEDDQWHYRTRGNHSVGPFANRHLAELALAKKVRAWSGHADPKAAWPRNLQASKLFRRSGTPQQ